MHFFNYGGHLPVDRIVSSVLETNAAVSIPWSVNSRQHKKPQLIDPSALVYNLMLQSKEKSLQDRSNNCH